MKCFQILDQASKYPPIRLQYSLNASNVFDLNASIFSEDGFEYSDQKSNSVA